MFMADGLMAQLGIDASTAFAGLAGGIVAAAADGKSTLSWWFVYAMCGSLTAIYLTDAIVPLMPFHLTKVAAAFVVGGCALIIIRAMRSTATRWFPSILNGKEEPKT